MSRLIAVKRKKISYEIETIDLYDFLTTHTAELYVSKETNSIEIRLPTRIDHYTTYVGKIPLSCVNDVESVKKMIHNNRHNEIFTKYLSDIVLDGDLTDVLF